MTDGDRRLWELVRRSELLPRQALEEISRGVPQGRLIPLLLAAGIDEIALAQLLEFELKVKMVDPGESALPALVLPLSVLYRRQMLPVALAGRRLTVGMLDPLDAAAVEQARLFSGCDIEVAVAIPSHIKAALRRRFRQASAEVPSVPLLNENDIAPMADAIIDQALYDRASDIHVEPLEDRLRIRFRVDGYLHNFCYLPANSHAALVSRLKVMGGMDIAERRLPQDGRAQRAFAGARYDIRMATLPTVDGEKIALRLLNKNIVFSNVSELAFSQRNLYRYRQLCAAPSGLILNAGPTGSGKSTTLYATLAGLNSSAVNIITVEDPVEYRLSGVSQVQVNNKAGLSFAGILKNILRQDPDIIMIGEIRDYDTATLAVRAAITGHLVLSTLHTDDGAGAVARLLDMGVESFLLAAALTGVVAQRLVRRICPHCRESYVAGTDGRERKWLGEQWRADLPLYRGRGCENCQGSGYYGRIAIQEVMEADDNIRDLIMRREPASSIRRGAAAAGMTSLFADGVVKALAGETTLEEVVRVAYGGS